MKRDFFFNFRQILQVTRNCRDFEVFLALHHDKPVRLTYEVLVMVRSFGRYLCSKKNAADKHRYNKRQS